jgi:hypothetical protein
LRNVGVVFIVSIPLVFVIDIDLTSLVVFLVILVMNGDAIGN